MGEHNEVGYIEPSHLNSYLCHLLVWQNNKPERLLLFVKAKSENEAWRKANNFVATAPELSHLAEYGESDWDIDLVDDESELIQVIYLS